MTGAMFRSSLRRLPAAALTALALTVLPFAGFAQQDSAPRPDAADTTADSAERLRRSVLQMQEQEAVERDQAARWRVLAGQTDDAEDKRERTARAEALEANAERLARRADEMELRIQEYEAERQRLQGARAPERLPDALIGRWQAAYIDRTRGPVRGEAVVHGNGRTIETRYGGDSYQAQSVSRSGDRFVIDLQRAEPSPEPTSYNPPGEEIGATPGAVSLGLGGGEATVTLATPEPAEAGRVRLVLSYDEGSRMLSGHWAQRVDAVTGRDEAGSGRDGHPILGSRETGGVVMTGREVWSRPEAQVKLVFATENQTEIGEFGEVAWPDPDGAGYGGRPVVLPAKRRILYVIGYGLPEFYGQPIEMESLDEDVDYSIHSLEQDMQRDDFEGFFGPIMQDAQDRVTATEVAGRLSVPVSGDETRMLITATLKDGVRPGPKTLRVNGAEATWQLTFGDHRAEMGFARDLADGLEDKPADAAFQSEWTAVLLRPESVYFEIRAARPLPHAEIPLLFSLNERALIFDGVRAVPALRQDDDPLTYRTGPIRIRDPAHEGELPAAAIRIDAYSGDRLTATLGLEAGTVLASPPAATALIVDHPIEAPSMAPVSEAGPALSWERAVREAALCHDIEMDSIGSHRSAIDNLARQPAESIDRYLLISWLDNDDWDLTKVGSRWGKEAKPGLRDEAVFRLNVDISVGQHGAMILSRRALVNALREQRRQLDELVDDDHVSGFRRTIEQVMTGRTPWDDLRVTGPDGSAIFFPQTFYDAILKRRYGIGGAALGAYQLAATREALALIRAHLDQAIALAHEPEDCDVEDMLILTGLGMRNVIERAKTVLMRCRDRDESKRLGTAAALTGGRCRNWAADRQARVHMDAVALVGASFAEQKAIAQWDHAVALLIATAVTLPVGATGGAIGASISAVVGTGGTVIGTIGGIQTERDEQRELDFARGAAIVIGNDRYRVAREFDISYTPVFINAMFGAFQIGNDVVAIRNAIGAAQRAAALATQDRIRMEIQAAYRKTRVELGRILAQQMLRREVSLAMLSRKQAKDLAMAAGEARALENSIGRRAMETAELSALRFAELVETGEFSRLDWSRRPPAGDNRPPVPPDRSTGLDPDATGQFDMPRFDPLEDSGSFAAADDRAWWSHDMSETAYRRLRGLPMVERDDVISLATRHPGEFSSLLADDLVFDALHRPQPSLQSLQDDVRRLGNRAPPRGRRYYEQAHPDAGSPDYLHFDVRSSRDAADVVVEVYFGRPAPTAGSTPDADPITAMVEQESMARIGFFKLRIEGDAAFSSGRRALVIDTVQTYPNVDANGLPPRSAGPRRLAPAPTWVRDVDIPLLDDVPGAPFAMYSEHRAMQALDIDYGDPAIGAVKLENVENANTAIELHWLRQNFPNTPDDELIRHTSLYRHVETMLEQAGFRITDARLASDIDWAMTAPAGGLVDDLWFDPGVGASLPDARAAYLRRFGFSRSTEVEIGFDIDLRVEPSGS